MHRASYTCHCHSVLNHIITIISLSYHKNRRRVSIAIPTTNFQHCIHMFRFFHVREEPFNANLLTVQCRCVLSPSPPQAGSSVLRATRLCQSEDSPVTAAANKPGNRANQAPGAKADTAGSTHACRRSFSRKIRLGHFPVTPSVKRLTTESSHFIQPLFCLT